MILQMGDFFFDISAVAAATTLDTILLFNLKQIYYEESFLISFSAIILAIWCCG